MKNKHNTAIWLEAVVCALAVVSGVCHYIRSGDWSWLLWVAIVICCCARCMITVKANEKLEREAEMWRVLYQKKSNEILDLAWEIDRMNK